MLQALFFDHDGTLAPTLKRQETWFTYWAEKNNTRWPFSTFEEFADFYNSTVHEGTVQLVYDKLNLPCDMKDRAHPVWNAYETFNHEHPSQLYAGIKETIQTIWTLGALNNNPLRNRRLRLGINTTNSWKSIKGDLEKGGILQYFDCAVTDEVLRRFQGLGIAEQLHKPSTISIALMLGLLDSEGEYTIHVGDTLNDLISSQKVVHLHPFRPQQVITIGACYGYQGRAVLEQGAVVGGESVKFNYLIDQPSGLVPIIETLLKEK